MASRKTSRLAGLSAIAAAGLLALPGVANADVNSAVTNGKLTITATAADAITVAVDAGNVKVNGGNPGGGPTTVAASTISSIEVTGGPGDNTINLAAVNATDFTALTDIEVDGGAGGDTINGSQFADSLSGGEDNDRIIGDDNPAGTRDEMFGDAGNDTLVWNPGDDDDVNEGGPGDDTSEVNGGGKEDFEVAPNATVPGRVAFDRVQPDPSFGAPFNVDISDDTEHLDLNAGAGDDIVNAAAGLDALGFSLDVDGGAGNDTIDGSDGADRLSGGEDNDRIIGDDNPAGTRDEMRGDAGNDTLVWNPGDDDDVNEGGPGEDTSEVNGGGKEDFEVTPNATVLGRVALDRVQPDPSFGAPFNVDISDDTEKLDLNAGAGDDIVNAAAGLDALAFALDVDGGDGNDTIDGSDGADTLSGGNDNDRITGDDNPLGTRDLVRGDAGDDTMVWNGGDDDDVNDGGAGTDTTEVNGAAVGEDFTFAASATPGHAVFDRTSAPGPFNIDMVASERLDLNANGGDDKLNAAGPADGLGGWVIDVDGGDGNDTLAGAKLATDLLKGDAGADNLNTRDASADTVTCGTESDSVIADATDSVNADCEVVDRGQQQQPSPPPPPVNPGGGGQPQPDVVAPRVKLAERAALVGHAKRVGIRVTCPAGEPGSCRITIELRRHGHFLGRKRITLAGGEQGIARVRLSKALRTLIAHRGKLGVRAYVKAVDDAGNARTRVVALTLVKR